MRQKTILSILLLFGLFSSCGTTTMLKDTSIAEGALKITPLSQNKKPFPGNYRLYQITVNTLLTNKSDRSLRIDFDDMFLLDHLKREYRVEFIQGLKPDSEGKLIWNLPSRMSKELKVEFLVEGKRTRITALKFKGQELKLIPQSESEK